MLIMWGAGDNWINVKQASYFEKDIPNSKVVIYENVGHVPMEEIPEKTTDDLIVFLEEN